MNIEVTKDEVIIDKNSDKPHENEYNITQCYFTFDDFIESFQVKRAIFTIVSTGEMYETDIINHTCETPIEVLKHEYETIKLGVYGYNIGDNEELLNRFSPSYAEFVVPTGSYQEGALSPEPITPSQYDLYSQALQEGLQEVDDKLDEVVETVDGKIEEVDAKLGEVDDKLEVVDGKIEDVDNAIERTDEAIDRTNNLNLDVSDKVDGDVTVTLTKKDASTKTVVLSDGTSLEFNWDGTKLGIKTSDEEEYTYVDLQGIQGIPGPQGEPFRIKKTYSSVAEMNADFNNMEYGDYVMIASTVEIEDNAKLYTRGETQWIFITDFSGATGIRGETGLTPSIQIGTVVSGATPSVTRTGTDETPVLNFVLQKGDKGDKGNTGDTGNGISSITKTSTSGLVDTYTITYTNGNTTTFNVSNGNGIDRIEKTATVGNKDTYTIYFTNGSTTTYEVSNGEVTREELEEEVERLSMIYNAFPSTTGEGEGPSINGTAEVPFKEIGLKGNTSQESTTGKNLFNWKDPRTVTLVKSTSRTVSEKPNENLILSAGTYTLSFPDLVMTNNNYNLSAEIVGSGTSGAFLINNSRTFTINEEKTITSIYIFISNNDNDNATATFSKIMIETGSTATAYEPYTNGPAPNPDYPYPVNVVTGDNEVKVEGKNLFDKNAVTTGKWLNISGELETAVNYVVSDYIEVISGQTYYIPSRATTRTKYYKADKSVYSNTWDVTSNAQAITIPGGVKYIRISIMVAGTGAIDLNTFQFEKSSTATTYTPYVSQTYPINLGSIELCKIGDYQDYIYKNNGNWYKYGAVNKIVFDGSEDWSSYNDYVYRGINKQGVGNLGYCDKTIFGGQNFQYASSVKTTVQVKNLVSYWGMSDTTTTTWRTYLSNNNLIFYYPIATPTITEITDTTLIEQLDNLEKAYSYDTQTNISQTNQDKPFIISYEAILSLRNVLNS